MAYGYLTTSGGFTVEGWFRMTAEPTTFCTLFTQFTQHTPTWTVSGTVGRQVWFGINSVDGAFRLLAGNEGGLNIVDWTDPSPGGYAGDSQWHHWALSLDAVTIKDWHVYLDGELLATTTAGAQMSWTPGNMVFLGSYAPTKGESGHFAFKGDVAYFAAFDKQLTTNRIFEHYTAGNGGTVYYGDDEVTRLNRVLDWAKTPDDARMLEPATTTLQGIQVSGSNALDQAQVSAKSAGGYVFSDGQASVQYHNKTHRYNRWVSLALGEQNGSSAPEIGMTFTTNKQYVYNDIRGSRPFGGKVRLQNVESQRKYRVKVYTFEVILTSTEELQSAVNWILSRYGEDRIRVSGVSFHCSTSNLLKELAYSRVEIGDKLVIDNLPDVAPTSSMEFMIEGINQEVDIKERVWVAHLSLSPADIWEVFEIGESLLGDGEYLAY